MHEWEDGTISEHPEPTTWAEYLEMLPVLSEGQASDLHVDVRTSEISDICGYNSNIDGLRVHLSRCGIKDGEPFNNTVYVERLYNNRWGEEGYFDGDETYPDPVGVLGIAYEITQELVSRMEKTRKEGDKSMLTNAEEFFYNHAGFSYDPISETREEGRVRCAKRLAAAEQWAKDENVSYEWLENTHDDGFLGSPETCEVLIATHHNHEAILGGIDDATDDIRRVVEAELALQLLDAAKIATAK